MIFTCPEEEQRELIRQGKVKPVQFIFSKEERGKLLAEGKLASVDGQLLITAEGEDLSELIFSGRVKALEYNMSVELKHQLLLEGKMIAIIEVDGQQVRWNPATEPDPRIKGNENGGGRRGKGGFRFSPYFHKKGIFLQDVAKLGMIKAIDTAHRQIVQGYDPEAYVYEDPRLLDLSAFFRYFIAEKFGDDARKLKFMYQLADIILFLMKEDVYYRARFFSLFKDIPRHELTEPGDRKSVV